MARIPRLIALLGVLSSAIPFSVQAALLVVPDQYPTIQSAVTAAADGDSVLVRAGVYVESVSWSGKGLHLFSPSGLAEITGNDATRVLDIGAGGAEGSVLDGFAITHGRADRGGGLRLGVGATVRLERCRFSNNTAFATLQSFGGAIYADLSSSLTVEDGVFRNNFASFDQQSGFQGNGGAIAAREARVTVERTIFERNVAAGFEGGPGGAIHLQNGGGTIMSSRFTDNGGGMGGAIYAEACLTLIRNVFEQNSSGYGAAAVYLDASNCIPSGPRTAGLTSVSENVCYDNFAAFGSVLEIRGPVIVASNTVAYNTPSSPSNGAIVLFNGPFVTHNLVAFNNGFGFYCYDGSASFACNDAWQNGLFNYGNCLDPTGTDGNISLDPQFCNGAARKFTIMDVSPCVPNASDCGLIGALGVGCTINGVPDRLAGDGVQFLAPASNPGPFPARLRFVLGGATSVRLIAYDLSGRELAVIADRAFPAGAHEVEWSGRLDGGGDAKPGVYWVGLTAGATRKSQRLVIVQ